MSHILTNYIVKQVYSNEKLLKKNITNVWRKYLDFRKIVQPKQYVGVAIRKSVAYFNFYWFWPFFFFHFFDKLTKPERQRWVMTTAIKNNKYRSLIQKKTEIWMIFNAENSLFRKVHIELNFYSFLTL